MPSVLRSRSGLAALILVASRPLAAGVVINEVCYDPPGADAGAEFVELMNTGAAVVDLAGWSLEFANGAVGPVWAVRWTGSAGQTIAPGGLFLIVDRGWTGTGADDEVRLGLQNGPDALRLVRGDGSVDLVGWGALDWPEMYEGRPHPGTAQRSLARRPDGRDTDDNAADFVPAERTPAARNWATFAVELRELRWEPPSLLAGGHPLTARLRLRNAGIADIEVATLEVRVGAGGGSLGVALWAAGQETTLSVTVVAPTAGLLAADLLLRGPATDDTCRLDLGRVQVGPAEVRLSEVMPAPAAGGEWCELVHTGSVPRNLAELALRDEDGAWRRLPARMLAPGDCLLVAQDSTALVAWLQQLAAGGAPVACDPQPPLQLAGWPVLNNSAPAGRDFADRLYLGAADGTVLDHVTMGLGSAKVPVGRSYERSPDLTWRPSTATSGATPGCLPAPAPVVAAGDLRLVPNPYDGWDGDGALNIHLTVPDGASGWTLRFYDLWGRLVRDLAGDDLGPGQRLISWDARDENGSRLSPGGYVAIVAWRHAGGGLTSATRRLFVVRGPRR